MAIMSNDKKAKLYLGNTRVKKVFAGDKRVYSAGNICTYHVDGNTYQEEVDEGASCLSPTSFIPKKDGWEFFGWRDSTTVGDALSEKVMGDEPVDLYAMFKYPDKFVSSKGKNWENPSWPSSEIILSGVETMKYCGIEYYSVDAYLRANFKDAHLYMYLTCGSDKTLITHAWRTGDTNYDGNYKGSKTLWFTVQGTQDIYIQITGDGTTCAGRFGANPVVEITGWDNNARLVGRTIVG